MTLYPVFHSCYLYLTLPLHLACEDLPQLVYPINERQQQIPQSAAPLTFRINNRCLPSLYNDIRLLLFRPLALSFRAGPGTNDPYVVARPREDLACTVDPATFISEISKGSRRRRKGHTRSTSPALTLQANQPSLPFSGGSFPMSRAP